MGISGCWATDSYFYYFMDFVSYPRFYSRFYKPKLYNNTLNFQSYYFEIMLYNFLKKQINYVNFWENIVNTRKPVLTLKIVWWDFAGSRGSTCFAEKSDLVNLATRWQLSVKFIAYLRANNFYYKINYTFYWLLSPSGHSERTNLKNVTQRMAMDSKK